MGFRFRIGPFTFGRSGTRLSLWRANAGISIPLSGKRGRTFGKLGFGPFRWFFNILHTSQNANNDDSQTKVEKKTSSFSSYQISAVKAFGSDLNFLKKLRHYGLPWRGVQERLKEELPDYLTDRDNIAYSLVPKAMGDVFGQQNTTWKTEKRPSKSGNGFTTWIVIIKTDD